MVESSLDLSGNLILKALNQQNYEISALHGNGRSVLKNAVFELCTTNGSIKSLNSLNGAAPSADSQEAIIEFLKAYRSFPCLWKYNDKHYRNKDIKDRAYAVLTEKMKEYDASADRSCVLRKINSLRTAFRREYKKMNRPILHKGESGYRTNLWYYNLLKFVVDEQDPDTFVNSGQRKSETNSFASGYDSNNEDEQMDYNEDEENYQPLVKIEMASPASSRSNSPNPSESTSDNGLNDSPAGNSTRNEERPPEEPLTAENLMPRLRVAKRISVINNDGYNSHYGFLTPDFDLFGTYVASKLKRVPKRQSIVAEKIIAEVLMRASLGTLEEKFVFDDVINKRPKQ